MLALRYADTAAQRVGLELDPLDRFARVATGQTDDELVPAQMAEHFFLADANAQRGRRVLDNLVAGSVAERGDYALETIETEAHDGELLVPPDGVAQ